jgi:uncharacterized membrane protein YoaK (UPF0700 family)
MKGIQLNIVEVYPHRRLKKFIVKNKKVFKAILLYVYLVLYIALCEWIFDWSPQEAKNVYAIYFGFIACLALVRTFNEKKE